jgi:hypothetical protein
MKLELKGVLKYRGKKLHPPTDCYREPSNAATDRDRGLSNVPSQTRIDIAAESNYTVGIL